MARKDIFEALGQFKRTTITNEAGDIFAIDCVTSETHSYSGSATEFPIEKGGVITDHVDIKPDVLTISGIQSDHPSDILSFVHSVKDMIANAPKKSKAAYDELEKAFKKREPLIVTTQLKPFENMIITNFNVPRDTTTTNALKFSIEFKQVYFVETTEEIEVPAQEVEKKAVKKTDTGKKAPKTAPAPVAAKAVEDTAALKAAKGIVSVAAGGTN